MRASLDFAWAIAFCVLFGNFYGRLIKNIVECNMRIRAANRAEGWKEERGCVLFY